uniref:Uncharacterized protein n=1 Tax=Oryza brachyantha TaxID=4533 RepID=J3N366_ORYBR
MGGGAGGARGGGGACCPRLWFVLVLSATATVLGRHCYDSGLGEGAAGVVRIEPVLVHRGSSQAPSYGGRK